MSASRLSPIIQAPSSDAPARCPAVRKINGSGLETHLLGDADGVREAVDSRRPDLVLLHEGGTVRHHREPPIASPDLIQGLAHPRSQPVVAAEPVVVVVEELLDGHVVPGALETTAGTGPQGRSVTSSRGLRRRPV